MNRKLTLIKKIVSKTYLKFKQPYFKVVGTNVECNICHYKANKFSSDSWHLYCTCPYCSSKVRQRLLVASLSFLSEFSFDTVIRDKKILHFAPEEALRNLLSGMAKSYKTADLITTDYSYDKIDYNIDISDMKSIEDETFDCVIACDVLEHVPNHLDGIREVYRILNNGGYCIFTVPQKDNLKYTFEDLSIKDNKERERVFGQYDHLRVYGDDFINMLQDSGFEVTAVNESFFEKKIVEQFVLFPPVLSKHPLATNYRKIFFGRKN